MYKTLNGFKQKYLHPLSFSIDGICDQTPIETFSLVLTFLPYFVIVWRFQDFFSFFLWMFSSFLTNNDIPVAVCKLQIEFVTDKFYVPFVDNSENARNQKLWAWRYLSSSN